MTTSFRPVSLPSIHEMFPEHLIPRPTPPLLQRPSQYPFNSGQHRYSFDVLRVDPNYPRRPQTVPSRPHTSPSPTSLPSYPSQSYPPSTSRDSSSSSSSSSEDMDMDAGEDGYDGVDVDDGGKKHVCPTCAKRFNRPSSLRIHENTHSGATPFRCPHVGCGRAFNVNSNMRRHFRNHAQAAAQLHPSSPVSTNLSAFVAEGRTSRSGAVHPRLRSRSRSPSHPSASPISASSSPQSSSFSPASSTSSMFSRASPTSSFSSARSSPSSPFAPSALWQQRESDVRSKSAGYLQRESDVRSEGQGWGRGR